MTDVDTAPSAVPAGGGGDGGGAVEFAAAAGGGGGAEHGAVTVIYIRLIPSTGQIPCR